MLENPLAKEIEIETHRRRTFAIISHPDAGKTTLTEKLLLYSGMIHTAGMVKGRKGRKAAASDWMAMEQERGISITASAMQFSYKHALINVLDTPGHQDFSEDTYRTLTAADSAIMVIDAAKGVEQQTRKLFEVCRLRQIPVLTFINKMDLPGRPPLDLMAEVEQVLGIHAYAMNWPVGSGRDFTGIVDRSKRELILFNKTSLTSGSKKAAIEKYEMSSPEIKHLLEPEREHALLEELQLLDEAGGGFSQEEFLAGRVTPVFFGSALTNFGLEPFFDAFIDLAPCPGIRTANDAQGQSIEIDPVHTPFSAYVFKLQANMDRHHRDSMAFLRICSGKFEKDLVVKHHRLGREVRLSRPHGMLAGERSTVTEGYPGDVIGVINPGLFSIGDTISMTGGFNFPPLPQFQPEIFATVQPKDIGKRKSFDKGVLQLTEEGSIQLLRDAKMGKYIFAAAGRLQFEVMQYRLKDEYGVETLLTSLPYKCSAWLCGDVESFQKPTQALIVLDRQNRPIVLFTEAWEKEHAKTKNPQHQLLDVMS